MLTLEFARIREISKDMEWFSWTSLEYQDAILTYLMEHRDQGVGVIEVGCYRGGLSALLSCVCRSFKWPFITMDIDQAAINSTKNLLKTLNLLDGVTLHHGSLATLVPNLDL